MCCKTKVLINCDLTFNNKSLSLHLKKTVKIKNKTKNTKFIEFKKCLQQNKEGIIDVDLAKNETA